MTPRLELCLPARSREHRPWTDLARYASGAGGYQLLFGRLIDYTQQARVRGQDLQTTGCRVVITEADVIRRVFDYGQRKPGGGWQNWLKARGRFITTIRFGDGRPDVEVTEWPRQARVWEKQFPVVTQEELF
jgi:hypothetical protein